MILVPIRPEDENDHEGHALLIVLDKTNLARMRAADPVDIPMPVPLVNPKIMLCYEEGSPELIALIKGGDLPELFAYLTRGKPGDGATRTHTPAKNGTGEYTRADVIQLGVDACGLAARYSGVDPALERFALKVASLCAELAKRPLPGETGPTGDYMLGYPMTPDDGGGFRVALSADKVNNVVRFDFGKPVPWLTLKKADVPALIAELEKMAGKLA